MICFHGSDPCVLCISPPKQTFTKPLQHAPLFPPQIIRQQLTSPTKSNPEIPPKMKAFQFTQKVLRAFSPGEKGEEYTVNKGVFYRGLQP